MKRFLTVLLCLVSWAVSAQTNLTVIGNVLHIGDITTITNATGGGGASIPQSGNLVLQWDYTGFPAGSDNSAQTSVTSVVGPNTYTGTSYNLRTGANGLNSQPVAEFVSGSSHDLFYVSVTTASQPFTICFIFKMTSAVGTTIIWSDGNGNMFRNDGGATLGIYSGSAVVGFAATDTSWHKLILVYNGASSTYSLDGAAPSTFSSDPGSGGLSSFLYFGSYAGSSFYTDVRIAATYIWGIGLTSGEQSTMNSYIDSVYGSTWPR